MMEENDEPKEIEQSDVEVYGAEIKKLISAAQCKESINNLINEHNQKVKTLKQNIINTHYFLYGLDEVDEFGDKVVGLYKEAKKIFEDPWLSKTPLIHNVKEFMIQSKHLHNMRQEHLDVQKELMLKLLRITNHLVDIHPIKTSEDAKPKPTVEKILDKRTSRRLDILQIIFRYGPIGAAKISGMVKKTKVTVDRDLTYFLNVEYVTKPKNNFGWIITNKGREALLAKILEAPKELEDDDDEEVNEGKV